MNLKTSLTAGAMIMFACTINAQECVLAPDGLVSWWPGDGSSDDIADGNTPLATEGTPQFIPAMVGQGMKFDGSPDGFIVADNSNLQFGTGSFSIDAWIRSDGTGPGSTWLDPVVDKRGPHYAGYVLGYNHGCHCYEFIVTGWHAPTSTFTEIHVNTSPVTDGAFHFIAGVVNRAEGTVRLYLDGVPQPLSTIGPVTDTSGFFPMYIGHKSYDVGTSLGWFNGVVDELEIFNRALSETEIQAIFNAGSEGKCKDQDEDGVLDVLDVCPDTAIPESVPTRTLGLNRWALGAGDGVFDTNLPRGGGPGLSFTTEQTGGCSCEQIIDALYLGQGHENFGCSISAMETWVDLVNP